MREDVKRRLAMLERTLVRTEQTVTIEQPDGTLAQKRAAEWWAHRHEWPLADFDHQDNKGGLVVYLVFAAMADEGIIKALDSGDLSEVERLTEERDAMLKSYFGDVVA